MTLCPGTDLAINRVTPRTGPLLLRLCLLAVVVSALVNPGNFGTIDTVFRLQVSRWIRLGEPPVTGGPGITGRSGRRAPGYGIGQSLVLLPFDGIASALLSPVLERAGLDAQKQLQGVEALIAFLMQSFLTIGVVVLAYQLLQSFGFASLVSAAGSLGLLFGTTCLQYVQCAQENLLLLLLALASLWAVRRWVREGGMIWCVAAGAASGFAILVRLTSSIDAVVIALLAVGWGGNWKRFLAGFLPPLMVAGLCDRWYHWYWFGEVFSTYVGVASRQLRPQGAPESFPFSYPFWKGFWGTLFSPDKSILLFDPLLVMLLAIALRRWRSIHREVRLLLFGLALMYILYSSFYAKFEFFGGDVAWGHRYVTIPVHLLCLLAVPLLMQEKALSAPFRRLAWAALGISVVLQAASTTISPQMEIYQKRMGYGKVVILNRAVNLTQMTLAKEDDGRTKGIPIEWRSLNYLPFQLRFRFLPWARWAIGGWLLLLLGLPLIVWSTLATAKQRDRAAQGG